MQDFFLNFGQATYTIFSDPLSISVFIAGLLGGMIFGAIPGVSMLTLAAIALPFSSNFSSENALMFFAVIYCSGVFGGAITAILFNIPGAPENAPTAFDGYPMTLKGMAGKAVGAAVLCSAVGGTASAILMMVATKPISDWAETTSSPEVFALVFFGVAVASSVGAKSLWKGWLSVLFGVVIAMVGTEPVNGTQRFDFGIWQLWSGFDFVVLILGFFAISEIFFQLERRAKGDMAAPKVNLDFPTLAEFWKLKFAVARSIAIGFFAGILPGIGATLAAFMGYNEAVRWSKTPENFGKGELEGVVSSETANNAATGAAMIPLLTIGIPGGALTAMMYSVFQTHNIEPGPLVFINSNDLVWIVFVAMFFANIAIFFLGWLQTKTVVHLLRVPFHLLAPIILLMAIIGAYARRNSPLDVFVMFAAGLVGYLMRRSDYSIPAIVLGVILGAIGEKTLVQGTQMTGHSVIEFVSRPVCFILFAAGAITIIVSVYKAVRKPA